MLIPITITILADHYPNHRYPNRYPDRNRLSTPGCPLERLPWTPLVPRPDFSQAPRALATGPANAFETIRRPAAPPHSDPFAYRPSTSLANHPTHTTRPI